MTSLLGTHVQMHLLNYVLKVLQFLTLCSEHVATEQHYNNTVLYAVLTSVLYIPWGDNWQQQRKSFIHDTALSPCPFV